MGLRASIYLTPSEAHSAIQSGDIELFSICEDIDPVELDKSWHALHYLITKDTQLSFLTGGIQFPDVDEICISHAPSDIANLYDCLSTLSTINFLEHYSAEQFNRMGIYAGPWDEEGYSYIEPYLIQFLQLLAVAKKKGFGLFVVIV